MILGLSEVFCPPKIPNRALGNKLWVTLQDVNFFNKRMDGVEGEPRDVTNLLGSLPNPDAQLQ